jgi:membrane protein
MAIKKTPIREKVSTGINFLKKDIWMLPLKELPKGKSLMVKYVRVILLALRGFSEDNIFLRSSALTFYSLLSIIPLLGLGFGVAKGFGLDLYLEDQLRASLSNQEEVFNWIMGFTKTALESAKGGVVAGVGLLVLLFIIFQVMLSIEESFNKIWQVKKSRHWARMISDYFSIVFIAPLFFVLSSAATIYLNTQVADLSQNLKILGFLGPMLLFLVNLVPFLFLWIMLTVVYLVMPNTNVRFSSALLAAIFAGTLLYFFQWAYVFFQVGVSRYNAIYGSFAAIPLLLIFLQIAWMLVLLGAEIAYAYQNVEKYEFEAESQRISPLRKKTLSVYVLHLVVQYFKNGKMPPDSEDISHQLAIPNRLVRSILNDMVEVNLLNEVQKVKNKQVGYQPALDINQISIQMVMERLDKKGVEFSPFTSTNILASIENSISEFQQTVENSDQNLLLKDI